MTGKSSALLTEAYGKWIESRLSELQDGRRWRAYIVTFMFKSINASESGRRQAMSKDVERFYALLLTRMFRRPRKIEPQQLPWLIALPDMPVPKHVRKKLREVLINDGLHFHAIMMRPPNTRLVGSLKAHVRDNQKLYVEASRNLSSIHVRRIRKTPKEASSYVLKGIKRGRASSDDILVLPRTNSELSHSASFRAREIARLQWETLAVTG